MLQPTRLWHPNDFGTALDSDTPGKRRSFVPDEYMLRQLQAPHLGQLSVHCYVCGQRVDARCAKPNEQRWNADQEWTCNACRKYGCPLDRWPAGHEYKYTCAYCGKHDGDFRRHSKQEQLSEQRSYESELVLCANCAWEWWQMDSEYVGSATQHEDMICAPGWYQVEPLGTCDICEEPDIKLADVTTIPAWLRKKGKYHVCPECVAAAKELSK